MELLISIFKLLAGIGMFLFAMKLVEEALKNLVEFSEEHKLYSEFDCTIEGRKFIKVVSPDNGCGRGLCAATRNGELCENLPECYDQQNFYIFKEVLDK